MNLCPCILEPKRCIHQTGEALAQLPDFFIAGRRDGVTSAVVAPSVATSEQGSAESWKRLDSQLRSTSAAGVQLLR